MKVAFFGITANPPHLNHAAVLREVSSIFSEVLVSPVFSHAFGKEMLPYEHRLRMLSGFLDELNLPNVKLLEIDRFFVEKNLGFPYSYNVLSFVKEEFGVDPVLILGEDNLKPDVWNRFYRHEDIERDFGVFICKDSGVHSTQIRNFCKNGQFDALNGLLTPFVLDYIKKNNLYFVNGEDNA